MANEVHKNDTSITLSIVAVSGANLYHLQVASDVDFVSLVVDDDALASPSKSFTDTGPSNSKRWYRWRSSADGGTTWGVWNDVGSYWLNTSGSGDVSVSVGKWKLFGETYQSDVYQLETFPRHKIIPQMIDRGDVRNRKGELLTEYVTVKDMIELEFKDLSVIRRQMSAELRRFHIVNKTFFLAACIDIGEGIEQRMIWKVKFSEDPELEMAAISRNDYFEAQLKFMEV